MFYVRVPDAQPRASRSTSSPTCRGARRSAPDEVESRAAGDPRGDRHARRHARRPRARPVRAGAVPRPPARPRGARDRGDDQRRCARDGIAEYLRPRTTARRTSSSPRPATSTTTTCGRRRARAASPDRRRPRAPANGPMAAAPHAARRRAPPRTEQAHVVLGLRARWATHDPDRYALTVVNQVLGGGMSQRLFQEIREKRGPGVLGVLVPAPRTTTPGAWRSTPAPRPSVCQRDARRHRRRARRSSATGLTDDELDVAKGHLRARWRCRSETRRAGCAASAAAELARGRDPAARRDLAHRPSRRRRRPRDRPGARRPARAGRRRPVRPGRPADGGARRCAGSLVTAAGSSAARAGARRGRGTARMIRVGVFGAGGRMGATVCQAVAARSRPRAGRRGRPVHAGSAGDDRRLEPSQRRGRRRVRRRRRRGRRRLHRARRRPARTCAGAPATACTRWSAPPGSATPTSPTSREPLRPTRNCRHRAELRHRRGADDALRRAGGAVLRDGRDHRAAPRPEDRRAVGHGACAPRERMAAASEDWARRPDHQEVVAGRAGRRRAGGIPVHSVRLRGPGRPPGGAARHDRADALDPPRQLRPVARSCPACCSPCKQVADHPGLTVGLDAFLGL